MRRNGPERKENIGLDQRYSAVGLGEATLAQEITGLLLSVDASSRFSYDFLGLIT